VKTKLLLGALLAVSAAASFAQQVRNIPMPASSSGSIGSAAGVAISESQVRYFAREEGAGSGGGATLLPHHIPTGWYTNGPIALSIVSAVPRHWRNAEIQVNGRVIDAAGTHHAPTKIVGTIPPGASFYVHAPSANVTALRNNATWRDTGVRFSLGTTFEASFSPHSPNMRSIQRCRYTWSTGVSWDNYQSHTYTFFVDAPSGCAAGTRSYGLGRDDGSGFTPRSGVVGARSSRLGGPITMDVNGGVGMCTASSVNMSNWDERIPLNTRGFLSSPAQCTPHNARSILNCGSIGCDNPPPPPNASDMFG